MQCLYAQNQGMHTITMPCLFSLHAYKPTTAGGVVSPLLQRLLRCIEPAQPPTAPLLLLLLSLLLQAVAGVCSSCGAC